MWFLPIDIFGMDLDVLCPAILTSHWHAYVYVTDTNTSNYKFSERKKVNGVSRPIEGKFTKQHQRCITFDMIYGQCH
jgi:hypothetical protein